MLGSLGAATRGEAAALPYTTERDRIGGEWCVGSCCMAHRTYSSQLVYTLADRNSPLLRYRTTSVRDNSIHPQPGRIDMCSWLTGAGGNGGLTSAVNSTAKSFPDRARASTTGLVISGFGLSAFIFSTVAHIVFLGDTSSFLLLLAIGTALPMILGFFLVRPIPLQADPHTHEHPVVASDADAIEAAAVIFQHEDNSSTHLLFHDDSDESDSSDTSVYDGATPSNCQEVCLQRPIIIVPKYLTNVGFLTSSDINNVGVMSQALYVYNNMAYDDVKAQKWQAVQVSTISITNFAGRIIIGALRLSRRLPDPHFPSSLGLISDITKVRFKLPRSYCLILVSSTLLASQYVATHIESIDSLWIASGILGLGYGSMFSLFPAMCIEWFGLRASFTLAKSNFCLANIYLSPFLGELGLSLHFSPIWRKPLFDCIRPQLRRTRAPERRGLPTAVSRLCLEGKGCYVNALYLTMSACGLCVFLSIWAAWRDRKRALTHQSRSHRHIRALRGSDEYLSLTVSPPSFQCAGIDSFRIRCNHFLNGNVPHNNYVIDRKGSVNGGCVSGIWGRYIMEASSSTSPTNSFFLSPHFYLTYHLQNGYVFLVRGGATI
ncbi:MFS substrate transporter [Salix suchowensis]|nr:MFS substrate transporter [Salix suchowensis]